MKIKPDFDKPYEMVAFIKLLKKDLKTSLLLSRRCLEINSNNIFAKYIFVLSSNLNSNDRKIKLL
jgi:hypothetical protein